MNELIGKALFTGKKFSPEILTIAGVVGVVISGILAARKTLKVEKVIDDHKDRLAQVKEEPEPEQRSREVVKAYAKTGGDLVKLYGPSVGLGVISIVAILGGHNILRKRNVAIGLAYRGLEMVHHRYREAVQKEFGTEKDRELELTTRGFVQEFEGTDEDGNPERRGYIDRRRVSPYARIFEEDTTTEWHPQAEYNLAKFEIEQHYFNDLLLKRGYIFLNEVYERLGFPHSPEGSVVGWQRDGDGDGYIDFNIFRHNPETDDDYYSYAELSLAHNAYLLDFNVDGPILMSRR